MARPRKELGVDANSRIVELMARGMTIEGIARAMEISKTTAFRRCQELKGEATAARQTARTKTEQASAPKRNAPAALPSDPDSIPDDTPLEQIGAWLKMARDEVDAARAAGESELVLKTTRVAAGLLAMQQKFTPVAAPDPNDNPDFIKSAKKVREHWHDLLNRTQ